MGDILEKNREPAERTRAMQEAIEASARLDQQQIVRRNIEENASFNVPYVTMNVLATIVACCGLLANSVAVVIGAMIIAMLLGPITGLALAMVDGDDKLLVRALLAETGGAALVFVTALVIGEVCQDFPFTAEMQARTRPNLLDLLIALAGGAAGAYATISPKVSVGLVGVAISTALVPPLSTSAMCLARGQNRLALGAFLLFFANLVAIQFASSLVLWLHGYHKITRNPANSKHLVARNAVSFGLLLGLSGLLGYNLLQSLNRQQFQAKTRESLKRALERYPGVALTGVDFQRGAQGEIVFAVVHTPYSLTPERVARIEASLPWYESKPVELHLRSVLVKEATRNGYLHELPEANSSGTPGELNLVTPVEGLEDILPDLRSPMPGQENNPIPEIPVKSDPGSSLNVAPGSGR